jgi:hypothetical protein
MLVQMTLGTETPPVQRGLFFTDTREASRTGFCCTRVDLFVCPVMP